ncbi:S8 family serine peptidase [Tenggerimyces flavus]|uniref:S8 family serine peptidase n=1 Tax=Tenggerimyces flavus TaxID=1708749 RepID=A0ABV7YLQ0_9ACTN|nr:S8 family serine peptidase [Tenggerimyces flavus]MBM7786182.1 subtilisin family serine protease [Tenggerimyces flavus]
MRIKSVRSRVLVLGAVASLLFGAASVAPAVAQSPSKPATVTPLAGTAKRVTLLTGDVVSVQEVPGGKHAATVSPGVGRERMSFQQLELDGDLLVIPHDAIPYLANQRLDRTLFNVTELIAQGYDDARSKSLPLIVRYGAKVDEARATRALPAIEAGPVLDSIDARALAADKQRIGTFWEALDNDTAAPKTTRIGELRLDGGVEYVWLDRKVRANLERSVPQIGAPYAWQAGFDGTGVKVAVLDTGVDDTHGDLAGKVVEARNFTTSPDTKDRFGHGTHVASTVAGTGAASGGSRKGVAPGAQLLAGKVLDDSGYGSDSEVIAGMQWAARAGAKVINMSLGGDPTDGTDLLSLSLNELTAETGALFVVSAGNSGQSGGYTVGSPGSASSALTVGAVARDETLAPFSSRGPRVGDFAIKPDITGPGVGIVAARAAGTSLGTPVDDHYTAASGTSMAAPHVAGAAAILAQQHPTWTAVQLKNALASTAKPKDGLSVFDQGVGRVDVQRAVSQGVFGTSVVDLGVFTAKDTAKVTKEVTYTNASAQPATLSLQLSLTGPGGALPADAVALDKSSLTVPAGGSGTVKVTVDPAVLRSGIFSGVLTARAGSVEVRTALGVSREAPRHRVTFKAVKSDGSPGGLDAMAVIGEDARFDFVGYMPDGYTRTLELAEGTYQVHGMVHEGVDPDGVSYEVTDPSFQVKADATHVFDVRKARPVRIETPKPAEQKTILSWYVRREFGARSVTNYTMQFYTGQELRVVPTKRVTDGLFEFGTRWQLEAPQLRSTARVSGKSAKPVELFLLALSQPVDGKRTLTVVDVGAGLPADYAGKDVRGKAVLVTSVDDLYEDRTRDAAAAGAAMAVIVPPEFYGPYSRWNPAAYGDRLPIPGALVPENQANLLRSKGSTVKLELIGVSVSPYLYDIMQVSHQQVPADGVHYKVSSRNTALVTTRYHESGGDGWSSEQRFGWRPWQDNAINHHQRLVGTGHVREEYVSTDGTMWQQKVKFGRQFDNMNELYQGLTEQPRTYRSGERLSQSWFAPVSRPVIPRGSRSGSYREADLLTLRVPVFGDGAPGHYGYIEGGFGPVTDVVSAQLYRDGTLIADVPEPWGQFPAGAASGTYRLDVDVARTSPDWAFSTRTRTSWTFGSSRTPAGTQALLPLLQLDYATEAGLDNRVPARRWQSIDLTVRHQDGLKGPRVKSAKVWASYDDGATWRSAAHVSSRGDGKYRVTLAPPKSSNGFVTLRVQATDTAGNAVDQTVVRAYGLK